MNRLVAAALGDMRTWKVFKMQVRVEARAGQATGGPRRRRTGAICGGRCGGRGYDEEAQAQKGASGGGGARRDLASMGRKKRAYRGQGRHHALSVKGAGASLAARAASRTNRAEGWGLAWIGQAYARTS